MGGNNNFMSKKGWNPSNMANQVKVGEAEAAAIRVRKEEAKKEEEVRKERAQEAIKREQAIAAGRPINTRVDWMYEGPSSGQNGTKEELEAVLLGKSRIDRFVKGNEVEGMKKDADVGPAAQSINMARDIASKVREDPMLAIKRQEQQAYEKMMSDPRMRERLLMTIGGEKKEKGERRHRHHHRRQRDERDDDRSRDHKRRRTDSEDRERRLRHSRRRSRSRTPERRRARSPERDARRDEPERDPRRRRSYSRSKSPPRRRRSPSDSRSQPPRRRSRSPVSIRRSPSLKRESRSPPPRRRSPSLPPRRRSPSPRRREDRPTRGGYGDRNGGRFNDRPSYTPRSAQPPPSISAEEQKAEMERKLAAMQADATELDLDREKRLAALAEREAADKEAEMKQAMKAQQYGGKADFVDRLHAKAGTRSLGDRIGGMKAGRRLEGGRED